MRERPAEWLGSGDAQPAAEERRIARDGKPYTYAEFVAFYGDSAVSMWDEAENNFPGPPPPKADGAASSAGDSTVPAATPPEPQTGAASTRIAEVRMLYTTATRRSDGDGGGGAGAGAASAEALTLLTPRTAQNIRDRSTIPTTSKKDMRAFLDWVSESHGLRPTELVHDIPDDVPWRHYVAKQAEWQKIIGSGIIRAQLEFLPGIKDPNRGQPRLDFVFVNAEGVRCQLHPGNKGKDANPIFIEPS